MKRTKQYYLNTNVGALVITGLALIIGFSVADNRLDLFLDEPNSDVLALTATSDLTKNLVDNFKSEKIDSLKWRTFKNGDVVVKQSAANNLVISVPSGGIDSRSAKVGRLSSIQKLAEGENFKVVSVLYRPVVTGDGLGASGIRFSSEGNDNDEGAVISWNVNSKKEGKVYFYVTGSNGKRVETKVANLNSNQAVFRLERVGNKYSAYYKNGNDTSADSEWTSLGQIENDTLGVSGSIGLFTNNAGVSGQYPTVLGRFDSVLVSLLDGDSALDSFADSFSNNVIESKWRKRASSGSTVVENSSDNLVMRVPAGAAESKPGSVYLKRLDPKVPRNKNFSFNARIYKPVVSGIGVSASGLSFVSTGEENMEAVRLMWQVGGNTNRLVFAVRNNKGVMTETASVKLKSNIKSLTLRLTRRGDEYSAWYRTGDGDTDFIKVGSDKELAFGSSGNVGLFTTNLGSLMRYPSVFVRFDGVSGSVEK